MSTRFATSSFSLVVILHYTRVACGNNPPNGFVFPLASFCWWEQNCSVFYDQKKSTFLLNIENWLGYGRVVSFTSSFYSAAAQFVLFAFLFIQFSPPWKPPYYTAGVIIIRDPTLLSKKIWLQSLTDPLRYLPSARRLQIVPGLDNPSSRILYKQKREIFVAFPIWNPGNTTDDTQHRMLFVSFSSCRITRRLSRAHLTGSLESLTSGRFFLYLFRK